MQGLPANSPWNPDLPSKGTGHPPPRRGWVPQSIPINPHFAIDGHDEGPRLAPGPQGAHMPFDVLQAGRLLALATSLKILTPLPRDRLRATKDAEVTGRPNG